MKKKNIMIIFLCAALLMICIIAYASEGQEENDNPNISGSTESEAIIDSIEKDSEQYAELSENEIEKDSEQNAELSENEIEHINTAIEEYTLVFDKSGKFKELTKEQLLTLGNIYSSRYRNTKLKKVLEFLGIIEEGLPSITMEEAKEICSDPELIRIKEGTQSTPAEYSFQIDVMKRFNTIAGAPDKVFPDPFSNMYAYLLDRGNSKGFISFSYGSVKYALIDKKTGEVTEGYMFESDRIAHERIKEKMRKEEEERRKVDPYELKGAYEFYYEKATAEQKAELEKVKNVEETAYEINCSESSKTEGFYEKKILEIMGEIPKDMPMLTFEQAKEICADETILMQCEANSTNVNDKKNRATINIIREKFDKIAGAPDWTYGNLGYPTSLRHVYFLNEEHTEYIVVTSVGVVYYREDGKGKELDYIRLTPYQELRKDGVYLG